MRTPLFFASLIAVIVHLGWSVMDIARAAENELLPVLDMPIPEGTQNVAWCPTLEFAWGEMEDFIGATENEPVRLKDPFFYLDALNQSPVTRSVAPPEAVFTYGGEWTDETYSIIDEGLGPNDSPQVIPKRPPQKDMLLFYAYLFSEVQFETPFEKKKNRTVFTTAAGETEKVKVFGIGGDEADKMRSQCHALAYTDPDNFALAIKAKQPGEYVVLTEGLNPNTMLEAVEYLRPKLPWNAAAETKFKNEDHLSIPIVDFSQVQEFEEMANKLVLNQVPGEPALMISKAIQSIDFALDEKGAKVRSEAAISMIRTSAPVEPVENRYFYVDKPFFVAMWREGQDFPYVMVHVRNAGILE